MRGYNGASLDSQVEVAVYGVTMNGGGLEDNRPKWEGEDEWAAYVQWVDRDATGEWNIDNPKYFDAKAYVTNWILVAQFDRFLVPYYTLSQVKMTARIVRNEERWFLVEGMTGGRMRTDEMLWATELLQDPEMGGPLCTNSPSYATLKESICASSDISYSGPDDGTAPCDGTSWGWRFEAKPARLKGVYVLDLPPICPAETSPLTDSCSTLGATSETRSRAANADAAQ